MLPVGKNSIVVLVRSTSNVPDRLVVLLPGVCSEEMSAPSVVYRLSDSELCELSMVNVKTFAVAKLNGNSTTANTAVNKTRMQQNLLVKTK